MNQSNSQPTKQSSTDHVPLCPPLQDYLLHTAFIHTAELIAIGNSVRCIIIHLDPSGPIGQSYQRMHGVKRNAVQLIKGALLVHDAHVPCLMTQRNWRRNWRRRRARTLAIQMCLRGPPGPRFLMICSGRVVLSSTGVRPPLPPSTLANAKHPVEPIHHVRLDRAFCRNQGVTRFSTVYF